MSALVNNVSPGTPELHIRPSSQFKEVDATSHTPSQDLPTSRPLISSGRFAGLPILPESSHKSSIPYLFCNETDMDKTLDFLSGQEIHAFSSVHIGFSLWFNFDVISITNPSLAIICDIDHRVMELFQMISSCLANSPSRDIFVKNFTTVISLYLQQVCNLHSAQDLSSLFNLERELSRAKSWLSSDEQFHTVKKMNAEGRILFQNLDLTDSAEKFSLIAKWMQERSLQTTTLYASNILEWIQQASFQKQEQALKNLRILTGDDTFFIQAYSPSRYGKKAGPQQIVTKGPASIQLPKTSKSR